MAAFGMGMMLANLVEYLVLAPNIGMLNLLQTNCETRVSWAS